MLHWIAAVYTVSDCTMHFQTNHWLYLAQIWRANSYWASSGLILDWSWSTEFLSFPGLWQLVRSRALEGNPQIGLSWKFGGQTQCWPPLIWLIFCQAPMNSHHFRSYSDKLLIELSSNLISTTFLLMLHRIPVKPGLWLVVIFPPISRYTAHRHKLKFGGLASYRTLQVWLIWWANTW